MYFFSMASLILLLVLIIVAAIVTICVRMWKSWQRQAREAGYASLGDYLRAAPHTDTEKKSAVDMALKGLVMCLLGMIFPPLLIIGIFPLFFGARKVAWASMGLGLVDDSDQRQS